MQLNRAVRERRRPMRVVALLTAAFAGMFLSCLIVVADSRESRANTACHALSMTINSNPRAEQPSTAVGHAHVTGNHDNSSRTNGTWVWRADNNGGSDGDTADTKYSSQKC